MSNQQSQLELGAERRLFLLDAMALIYRAHFALIRSPRFTSAGTCTSAVFGLANTVLDLLKTHEPTHIAIAFDTDEPTHRHAMFEEYKAQRDALPEDISAQVPLVVRLMNAMQIAVIMKPGFEADDIIGTLAKRADEAGFRVWMVTPDKDFHQLVTDDTVVYKPGRQGGQPEILGTREVIDKWQVDRVDQVIDILGLMGDSSDNIPGVPGIGEKTAQKLIARFGSVENLLDHVDQLKGKQKENIQTHAELAKLSKELVTICTDVPIDVDLESLRLKKPDEAELKALFAELEFDALGKRVFGKSFSSSSARTKVIREKREKEIQQSLFDQPVKERTLREVAHDYSVVVGPEDRLELIQKLGAQTSFCFDTETTGLDARQVLPLGIAFAFESHRAYYAVCPKEPREAKLWIEEFRPLFENADIDKVGHNLKYDLTLLKWNGVDVQGKLFDTMLAHTMKEPEMQHGLDYLAKLYLGYKPVPTSELIGPRGSDQKSMAEVPIEQLAQYACEDADITWQLSQVIRRDIDERGVSQVCYDVECPLIPVLVDMEFEGIRLDHQALGEYSTALANEIEELRESIYRQAGHEFNIDSPRQLATVIYDELELVSNPKKTATGQYTTREAELLRLAPQHEIVRDVLEYRNAVKLKSVYVDQLPAAVHPRTGRLHTHYSQTWTATGRIQSNNPNLQTIPVRKQRGREIRAAFIARDDDYVILSADYSQIELRIMADLSGDAAMIEAFTENTDIHQVTASKVFQVPVDDVTREMRDQAKTVNFGIIYGISAFGLQQRLNIARKEASALIDNYFEKYPAVRHYIDKTIEFAREHGYVATRTGRRRYIRDIGSRNFSLRSAAERLAMNSPIQGTAADLLKLAMIKVHNLLKQGGFKSRMLLTVHDELVFDLYRTEEADLVPQIVEAMETALPMQVPIRVETGTGRNWLEAH